MEGARPSCCSWRRPGLRGALVLGLTDQGYEVIEAGSGSPRSKRSKAPRPERRAADLMLPGMDGFASDGPRTGPGRPAVIMINGVGSDDVIPRAGGGRDDYVTKAGEWSEPRARVARCCAGPGPGAAVMPPGDVRSATRTQARDRSGGT